MTFAKSELNEQNWSANLGGDEVHMIASIGMWGHSGASNFTLGHTRLIVGVASPLGSGRKPRSLAKVKILKVLRNFKSFEIFLCSWFVGIKGEYRHCFNMFSLSQACQQLKNSMTRPDQWIIIDKKIWRLWRAVAKQGD